MSFDTQYEAVLKLKESWISSQKCQDGSTDFRPDTINSKGEFELWIDTHGSGSTYTAPMNAEQLDTYQSFLKLEAHFKPEHIRVVESDIQRIQSNLDRKIRLLENLKKA